MAVLLFAARHSLADVPGWFLVFLVCWLFFVGGSIGSFLNVVIYRLPHGISVTYPSSRCPKCLTPIKWYDNLPVLSWFLLRGRCRSCQTTISPRYVLIELLVAGVFVGFAVLEAFSDGRNLPDTTPGAEARQTALVWGSYGLHMVMMSSLVAATFIVHDRYRLPPMIFATTSGLCFLAFAIWPHLSIVPFADIATSSRWLGMMSAACGALVGMGVGLVATLGLPVEHRAGAVGLFALCGTLLGWQAVLVIGFLSVWLLVLESISRQLFKHRELPWPLFPTLVTGTYIAIWNQLGAVFPQLVGG